MADHDRAKDKDARPEQAEPSSGTIGGIIGRAGEVEAGDLAGHDGQAREEGRHTRRIVDSMNTGNVPRPDGASSSDDG